jgi:hypothetical protein
MDMLRPSSSATSLIPQPPTLRKPAKNSTHRLRNTTLLRAIPATCRAKLARSAKDMRTDAAASAA